MAIFITGDTHADFERFKKEIFYERSEERRVGKECRL